MLIQKSHGGWRLAAGWLLCAALAACSATPRATQSRTSPVSCQHIIRRDPNFSIHVVTVDLSDPRVSAHVARGGPDPDGNGPWVTTLLPTSEIASREHFDIAVNGDFFDALSTKDVEGRNTGYVRGKPAAPIGLAMTGGQLWHQPYLARPYLEITAEHTAKLVEGHPHDPIDPAAREIIGGGQIIVRDGQPVVFTNNFATARHPRTVAGLAQGGRELVFFVVDGRQPDLSIGMTLAELSAEMVKLGCDSAINLDGGGSTTLVYREPDTKELKVLNSPSDMKERSVADILGVAVNAPMPEAN